MMMMQAQLCKLLLCFLLTSTTYFFRSGLFVPYSYMASSPSPAFSLSTQDQRTDENVVTPILKLDDAISDADATSDADSLDDCVERLRTKMSGETAEQPDGQKQASAKPKPRAKKEALSEGASALQSAWNRHLDQNPETRKEYKSMPAKQRKDYKQRFIEARKM